MKRIYTRTMNNPYYVYHYCFCFVYFTIKLEAEPDLPIGYMGLSLGPQDPWGHPANCGMHRVNCRYMISSTIICHNFMP